MTFRFYASEEEFTRDNVIVGVYPINEYLQCRGGELCENCPFSPYEQCTDFLKAYFHLGTVIFTPETHPELYI